MIPSILHQIWLDNPIDKRVIPLMEKAKGVTDEYYLWTDKNIWKDINCDRVSFAKYWNIEVDNPVALSDILRALIIQKYGGFYADSDIEFFRSLKNLTQEDFISNIKEVNGDILRWNDFFGAIPNHPFINFLIIVARSCRREKIHWTERVGFLLFERVIDIYKNLGKSLPLLSSVESDKLLRHHNLYTWRSKK